MIFRHINRYVDGATYISKDRQIEINYWDIAAGIILIRESGGFIDSLNDRNFTQKKIDIIATNSKIHKELKNLL